MSDWTVRVIDIETTGLDPAEDRICEIGAVDWTPAGITGLATSLVNPGRPIPAQAKAVHHITEIMVGGAPSPADAMQKFAGADIVVAHRADFEQGFLGADYARHWVCTYKASLRVWPDLPSHSNQFLRYHLGLTDPPDTFDGARLYPHRALYDAVTTGYLFCELTKHLSVREMVQISREPALLTVLTFGKHRGLKFAEAPRDYLEWLIANHDDVSIKFSARRALEAAA